MRGKLVDRKLTSDGVDEVITLLKGSHFQLACQKVFTLSHPGHLGDGVGNHPNGYFEASVAYMREKKEKESGGKRERERDTKKENENESSSQSLSLSPSAATSSSASSSSPSKPDAMDVEKTENAMELEA